MLSVIIPCYNAADTIGVQLAALASQTCGGPWEVIVADNGSMDGTREVVARYRDRLPNLRIADASARGGSAYARNTGARLATGDRFVFCDADDEVAPGWLAAMSQALTEHDFVASRFDLRKLNSEWLQYVYGYHPQQDGVTTLPYPPYLPHAGGSGLGIKKAVHDAIGGFDESLPFLQDTEYCIKAQLAGGVKLHFVGEAVLHVRYRNTAKGVFRQARSWAQYNVLMYQRYRTPGTREYWRWRQHVKEWTHLLRKIRDFDQHWLRLLGWQIGKLIGSLKYRVPPI